MASQDTVPTTVRVRTDPEEDLAHRYETIATAADELDKSKTQAILTSCDVVGNVLPAIERALEHEDLPPRVVQEVLAEISRSTRYVDVGIQEREVSIEVE